MFILENLKPMRDSKGVKEYPLISGQVILTKVSAGAANGPSTAVVWAILKRSFGPCVQREQ